MNDDAGCSARVVGAASLINAHEVWLSPPDVNLRPSRVVGAASLVNTVILEKELLLVSNAALLNASAVNAVRLVEDQNIAAAVVTNVSSVADAEVASEMYARTVPGKPRPVTEHRANTTARDLRAAGNEQAKAFKGLG